jgi:RNA-directed DNA polymerase
VLDSVTKVIEGRLHLVVNRVKSKVVPASVMTMLGSGFYFVKGGGVRVRVDPKAIDRLKFRIKELTSRRWSIVMDERIAAINRYVVGWMGYFRLADTPTVFSDLDEWFRRRTRQIRWKEWKRPKTRRANLHKLGISRQTAYEWSNSSKGNWRIVGSPVLARTLTNSYRDDQGLKLLKPTWQRLRPA